MSIQQPDDQPVMVSPVYLAGAGDTATIYGPLDDTRGWGKAITDSGLCFTSPRLDTHVAYLPESRYGGWKVTRYNEPLGMPIWSAAFSRCTPAEITAAFTRALAADNLDEEHHPARRPIDALAERGWREDNTQLHRYHWSPDGHAYLSRRTFSDDSNAELQGDSPARWTMRTCMEKVGAHWWHADFTDATPMYLVTAAVNAFSSTEPVERPRSGVPERNLPYVTATPAAEPDPDRLRWAALARTPHTQPTARAPFTGTAAPDPTLPAPFRRR